MLPDGVALDGAALGGAPLVITEGAVTFDCAASVSAAVVINHASTATTSGAAEISATATGIRTRVAVVDGESFFLANRPLINHAAALTATGTGSFSSAGFIIRPGAAAVTGTADITAVGATNDEIFFAGVATVDATITYIHSTGQATAACTGGLVSSDVDITRYVSAAFDCSCEVGAAYDVTPNGQTYEINYNGIRALATGELAVDVGLLFFNQSLLIDCTSPDLTANPYITTHARADFDVSGTLTPTAEKIRFGEAPIDCTSDMTAAATRVVLPSSDTVGDTEFTAQAWVMHQGVGTFSGDAELAMTALGVKVDMAGIAVFDVSGAFSGVGQLDLWGRVDFDAGAEVIPLPVNLEKIQASAVIEGTAEVIPFLRAELRPTATIDGPCEFYALGRSNMDADDPPERVMRRPYTDREMRRPFVDRVMREAA
jgi:hypothetical protein